MLADIGGKAIAVLRDAASWLTGGLIDDSATAKTKDNAEKIMKAFDDVGSATNKNIEKDKNRLAVMEASGAKEKDILAQKKKD